MEVTEEVSILWGIETEENRFMKETRNNLPEIGRKRLTIHY